MKDPRKEAAELILDYLAITAEMSISKECARHTAKKMADVDLKITHLFKVHWEEVMKEIDKF